MAKYLDDNGLLYFWQKIKTIFATQSDLSALQDEIDDIVAEGGEPNTIDTVKVNGSALTPDANKAVNITITEGTDNGTIKVNGSNVEVHGLGTAAFTGSGAYDSAGSAAAVQNNVDTLSALVGSTAVATQISNAIGALDSSVSAETNKAISALTITNGKITASSKVTIPTNNNQLTNGAGYQTASDVSSAINSAISGITGISFEVVTSLPSTGAAGTIYLISNSGSGTNTYDEYIYVNNKWEMIGTTNVDLSSYWNTSNLTAITNAEIDTILAA